MKREDLEVGQPVHVVWLDPRRAGVEITDATIRKIGRTLVTIGWGDPRYDRTTQFYIDSGYDKTAWTPQMRFVTDEQRRIEERIEAAKTRLESAGVRLAKVNSYGTPYLTVEVWETIAAAVSGSSVGAV